MYETLKILHLFSLIAWMIVLFYTPRLFVYHVEATKGGELDQTLKTMERRLMLVIGLPASLSTWIFGLSLMLCVGYPGQGWLHVKILLVVVMTAYHMFLANCRKKFASGDNQKSARFFRIINEIPTVLLIVILILVVAKPF